jgi:hypothetical protein
MWYAGMGLLQLAGGLQDTCKYTQPRAAHAAAVAVALAAGWCMQQVATQMVCDSWCLLIVLVPCRNRASILETLCTTRCLQKGWWMLLLAGTAVQLS